MTWQHVIGSLRLNPARLINPAAQILKCYRAPHLRTTLNRFCFDFIFFLLTHAQTGLFSPELLFTPPFLLLSFFICTPL
jgi:hypothetical protein